MALGSWDPDAAQSAAAVSIDPSRLQQFINWSQQQKLDELETLLGDDSQSLAGLMRLDSEAWLQAVEDLSSEDIAQLVRFFAVAENLPGWEAGDKSPVIPLARILRQRGDKLDRDFLLWLRSVNKNRFLPYGPL
jgi:hypothetical protein